MTNQNQADQKEEKQRKPRSDVGPRITERDQAALRWIAQQYAVRLDHLQVVLARLLNEQQRAKLKEEGKLTERRAQDVVDRWVTLGLVKTRYFLAGEPPWIWVSAEGLTFLHLQPQMRYYEPKPATLAHLHACNQARLAYPRLERERRQRQGMPAPEGMTWKGEREIRAEQEPLSKGQKPPHLPDAIVVTTGQAVTAIEVELTMKTYARLDRILRDLAANQRYTAIWYFTPSKVKIALDRVVSKLPESFHEKFVTCDLEQLE